MARMYSDEIVDNANKTQIAAADRALQMRQLRNQERQAQLDEMVKYAGLADAGYSVRQAPRKTGIAGMFGGGGQMTLEKEPGFQGLKELQRQELQDKLEMNNYKKKAYQQYFGEGANSGTEQPQIFGQGVGQPQTFGAGAGQGGDQAFVMTPDGRFVSNPNRPKPLNDLQQAQLADRKRKQAESEKLQADQQEALRVSAEDSLGTIGEVKKGLKYFGPMKGNLPSAVTTFPFSKEQGDRKNWEANIEKLLSQKVLDVMTKLKETSKTGATGFGAMNEKELTLLQNAATALRRDLNPDDAARYLNDIETIHRKVLGSGERVPEFASESDIPPGFKGRAKVGGVTGMVN